MMNMMNLALPISGLASGLASLWIGGARIRAGLYQLGLLRQSRLQAKVISIGNLSWGGAGKTPFTIWLAQRLQAAGLRVSILTRGYRRSSQERVKVHAPGTLPEAARQDGDEVQIYLRHLNVPVGISSSRWVAGKVVEESFSIDVHLLDDGFQHLALARDLDLVLVDAANPWGSRPGWPLLLREGFSSLRRAHAVLLTRCELLQTGEAGIEHLKRVLRSYNPAAPCFPVRTNLIHFTGLDGEHASAQSLAARQPAAFCALGNPRNFFATLARAGIVTVARKTFADHHRYHTNELELLARWAGENRADCLITTEKDIVNFPSALGFPLPIYWAAIEPVVENAGELIAWIEERLHLHWPDRPHLASAKQSLEAVAQPPRNTVKGMASAVPKKLRETGGFSP